jgi:hypothetical protein
MFENVDIFRSIPADVYPIAASFNKAKCVIDGKTMAQTHKHVRRHAAGDGSRIMQYLDDIMGVL